MQILKEEVRQRILQAAREEFLEKGFQESSMRRIAQKAGVTPGNIYAYFPGKEALFERLVEPAVADIRRLLETPADGGFSLENLADRVAGSFLANQIPFRLLTERADGTRYGRLREDLIDLISRRIRQEHLCSLPRELQSPSFAEALSRAFIGGLLCLLWRYDGNEGQLRASLSGLMRLLFRAPEEKEPVCEL